MRAKEFLIQIRKINAIIANKVAEREQLKACAVGTSSRSEGERVQATGSMQKMEDAVVTYVDLENEINMYITDATRKKNEIISVIEKLPFDEYDVLHKIYVQQYTIQEVSDILGKSYSYVTHKRKEGIAHLDKILEKENIIYE